MGSNPWPQIKMMIGGDQTLNLRIETVISYTILLHNKNAVEEKFKLLVKLVNFYLQRLDFLTVKITM